MSYQKKINDFNGLLNNHEFTSNVLAFMQAQTLPNIWFKQFNLDEKNSTIQLSGEADSMDAFSRQVVVFEGNKYVKSLGNISSSMGASSKVEFSINLTLDQSIFSYISSMQPTPQATVQPLQSAVAPSAISSTALITSFNLLLNPLAVGVIDENNFVITVIVPKGTDVKHLTPRIAVSSGATVSPVSGIIEDFTNPMTYVVIGRDGSSQNYKVIVKVSNAI